MSGPGRADRTGEPGRTRGRGPPVPARRAADARRCGTYRPGSRPDPRAARQPNRQPNTPSSQPVTASVSTAIDSASPTPAFFGTAKPWSP